jgi:hypothetical protein
MIDVDALMAAEDEKLRAILGPDEPLPPFSGDDPICPKCGHAGARVTYRAHGDCVHHAPGLVRGFRYNERLHRECYRCDYAWDEAIVEAQA